MGYNCECIVCNCNTVRSREGVCSPCREGRHHHPPKIEELHRVDFASSGAKYGGRPGMPRAFCGNCTPEQQCARCDAVQRGFVEPMMRKMFP